jgi:beta-glucosidase
MQNQLDYPMSMREKRNASLSREAAASGMVLLENRNGTLPLKAESKKIALFGCGAVRTVRGGTGSGDPLNGGLLGGGIVHVNQSPRYHINIMQSFLSAGYHVVTKDLLNEYAAKYDAAEEKSIGDPLHMFVFPEMSYSAEQVSQYAKMTDTAVYVISRNSGEGADRCLKKNVTIDGMEYEIGDYELSQTERNNVEVISNAFPKMILVLNVGGVVDMSTVRKNSKIGAVLLMSQAGQEGGDALLDVLTGRVTPSGKLTATWAMKYSDYPASATFAYNDNDVSKEKYEEGIYVGYRYFDTFGIEPCYEFGYGLSYTEFSMECQGAELEGEWVKLQVKVKNEGSVYSGREVVQVYYSAPGGWNEINGVEKPFQELASFAKTKELKPGESQTLFIRFRIRDMASYCEKDACYRLDEGDYRIRIGNSSRHTIPAVVLKLKKAVVTEQLRNEYPLSEELHEISKAGRTPCRDENWEDESIFVLTCDGNNIPLRKPCLEKEEVVTYTTDPDYKPTMPYEKVKVVQKKSITLKDVKEGRESLEDFVAQMDTEELATLNCGTGWGVTNQEQPIIGENSSTIPGAAGETTGSLFAKYGIPSIVMADGPAGIRVKQEFEATDLSTGKKVKKHQFCTVWPVGTLLAQSFDRDLLFRVGCGIAEEMEEYGITMILGPSLNIHRDPLCGRNFEYFSEDPLVSGLMAAAITRGIQSRPGTGACIKHYAANNQESNRYAVDTIVSERALREIYLKGFEIAVKTAQPMAIMTSYNLINGVPTADSRDLNTDIARGEWGFQGLIMTDWNGGASTPYKSMHAGNDLIMPGGKQRALNIVMAVETVMPNFDDKGQIVFEKVVPFLPIRQAMWNSFTPKPDGKDTVTANLKEGYTAEEKDGVILVNGEKIHLNCVVQRTSPADFYMEYTDVTTDVAHVTGQGRQIVYRGNLRRKRSICIGNVQRCACHNLKVIMNSLAMYRTYPQLTPTPFSEHDRLEEWI